LVAGIIIGMAGCSGTQSGNSGSGQTLDLNSLTMDKLIAGAKAEGHIESVGMPDDWAAWERSWNTITAKYGITHYDTDMSSAEEISIFIAEKDDPTRDIGDIGLGFTVEATAQDIVQAYKVSTWDSIPDWAKDPEGRWVVSYTGTICFIVNENLTNGVIPTTWQELKDSEIVVSMGNVIGGASAQTGVLSCAIAMGGGFDNVQPGIDFFVELAKAKRLEPGPGNRSALEAGEIQLQANRFDFDGVTWQNEINASSQNIRITATIPQDGAITTGYALIFNKYSPHPHATALTLEYMLSDEGQIDRAYGGARPIRNVTLPGDISLLPSNLYNNAIPVTDAELLAKACSEISKLWEEQVMPLFN
jgi:putative spermidine/putrescine transport system substrate-binding protein